MLAISLRLGISRNSEHLLVGTSLGADYMKQGKYVSGGERGDFEVVKVNLPLLAARLRLFLEGKEDRLEEGLLVPVKENKIGRIVKRKFFRSQEEGAHKIMSHHLEGFRCRRVTMVVYQCKHGGVVQPCPHRILRYPT
jgi:hypothetical protein